MFSKKALSTPNNSTLSVRKTEKKHKFLQFLADPINWIFLGIPVQFLLGTLSHYIYELTNQNFIVGLFNPVNESIFEHTKLVLLPIIFWYSLYFLVRYQYQKHNKSHYIKEASSSVNMSSFLSKKNDSIKTLNRSDNLSQTNKMLLCCNVSLVCSALSIPTIFYLYTGVFGIQLIVVDIIILLVSLTIGQSLAVHIYKYSTLNIDFSISIIILLLITLLFAYLTLSPPHIPFFKDPITHTYGIFYTI